MIQSPLTVDIMKNHPFHMAVAACFQHERELHLQKHPQLLGVIVFVMGIEAS
jgi:hypothetical protein